MKNVLQWMFSQYRVKLRHKLLIDGLTMDSCSYSPDAHRPYRRSSCAPQSDIISRESCTFTKVPDGPQT